MHKELQKFFGRLVNSAQKRGFILDAENEINYGLRLKFRKKQSSISLNIYYSKKKGISYYITSQSDREISREFKEIIFKLINKKNHQWKKWAGTDESGKGDFFGPLVACGFVADGNIAKKLIHFGVADSKKLSDKKIVEIAKKIYANFAANIELIILKPSKYNELYQKFRNQNKKLNHMLAWMHSRIILNLNKKHNFKGTVIDKFAHANVIKYALKDMKNITFSSQIKAESDIAVAAASIIARYHFLQQLKALSKKYDISLTKGASKQTIKKAKEFAKKYSKARLSEVAKVHFKTINKI